MGMPMRTVDVDCLLIGWVVDWAHSSGIGRLQPINGRNLVLASQKAQKNLQYGRTDSTNLPDCEMKGI